MHCEMQSLLSSETRRNTTTDDDDNNDNDETSHEGNSTGIERTSPTRLLCGERFSSTLRKPVSKVPIFTRRWFDVWNRKRVLYTARNALKSRSNIFRAHLRGPLKREGTCKLLLLLLSTFLRDYFYHGYFMRLIRVQTGRKPSDNLKVLLSKYREHVTYT